jgi:hypothetical protein
MNVNHYVSFRISPEVEYYVLKLLQTVDLDRKVTATGHTSTRRGSNSPSVLGEDAMMSAQRRRSEGPGL